MTSNGESMTTQEFIDVLLSPDRIQSSDPLVILSFVPINAYETVADIGCGPGYFTIPLAKSLINGKLYAVDVNDEMVAACRERVRQARMGNVEVDQCGEFDFPIEPASLDGAFLAFVVHHSEDRGRFLDAVRGLMQPRGWCSVLEWFRKDTGSGPPLERRIDPGELEETARAAGFRTMGWRPLNDEHYLMTLRNT